MGFIQAGGVASNALKTLLVPLALAKGDALKWFHDEFAPKHALTPAARKLIRERLADHESVRNYLTPYATSNLLVELSWVNELPPGAV
eukprot:11014314-Alexandrium_andersonii.AAC.1